MGKWADYVIVAANRADDNSHISIVKRRPDLGDQLGDSTIETKTEIVSSIKDGKSHVTAYWKDKRWVKGEDVRVVNLGGYDFIRTDRNETKADNLGELPKF